MRLASTAHVVIRKRVALFFILFMLYYFRNLKVKERKNMQISKDTVIGTILDSAPETAPFFLEMGMHCLGCPSARSETVAQACMVHGVNADDLVSKINAFLADK